MLLGEPTGSAIAKRALEEGPGETVASRVSLSVCYFRDAAGIPGFEVRTHVYGSPAGQSPVLHLRRVPGGRVFDHYMRSFEKVWSEGTQIGDDYTIRPT